MSNNPNNGVLNRRVILMGAASTLALVGMAHSALW
jgi:hypothetical protein